MIDGMKVITSSFLTEKRKRSWKERLFSLPWTPFRSTKEIPSEKIYFLEGRIVMHPYWADQLNLPVDKTDEDTVL